MAGLLSYLLQACGGKERGQRVEELLQACGSLDWLLQACVRNQSWDPILSLESQEVLHRTHLTYSNARYSDIDPLMQLACTKS